MAEPTMEGARARQQWAAALAARVGSRNAPSVVELARYLRLQGPLVQTLDAIAAREAGLEAALPHAFDGALVRPGPTLGGLLANPEGGAVPSVLDFHTGTGDWLRRARRQAWLAPDARVLGSEQDVPSVYTLGRGAVSRDVDWKGLDVRTPSNPLPPGVRVSLLHHAFRERSLSRSLRSLDEADALVEEGGTLLFAHSDDVLHGGIKRRYFLRWLRLRGYKYTVFDHRTGVPEDYPRSSWWKVFGEARPNLRHSASQSSLSPAAMLGVRLLAPRVHAGNRNYLIVARKITPARSPWARLGARLLAPLYEALSAWDYYFEELLWILRIRPLLFFTRP